MKKKRKKINLIFNILIILVFIGICIYIFQTNTNVETVKEKEIDLTKYNSNIKIVDEGEYTLTGDLAYGLIIDAKDKEVTLNFKNVNLESTDAPAIFSKNAELLTINLLESTVNYVNDLGKSKHKAAIYSQNDVIIKGLGTLYVDGNQEKGNGIKIIQSSLTLDSGTIFITGINDGINSDKQVIINDTNMSIKALGDGIESKKLTIHDGSIFIIGSELDDSFGIKTKDGYIVNGGTFISTGFNINESPESTSKQKMLLLTLDNAIEKETLMSLQNIKEKEIISFVPLKKFKTLVISTPLIKNDTYNLYESGTHTGALFNGVFQDGVYTPGVIVAINNNHSFKVTTTINTFSSIYNTFDKE